MLRYTAPDARRREMGLGPAHRETLAASGKSVNLARTAADKARALLAGGRDPIECRKAKRNAAQAETATKKATAKAESATLARVARKYHEAIVEPRRTTKHAAQWIASLENNVPAGIWHAPIDSIEPAALLDALAPLRKRVPETCDRVRQRLEVIFDDALFYELCATNPAKIIRRKLADLPSGRQKGKFRALPYVDVPGFLTALRKRPGTAARALEFALLTAARTGEILGCVFEEIDTVTGVWRVPGNRMKGDKSKSRDDHVVHLTPRALEIIEAQREQEGAFVFPSPMDREKPMSNMAMLNVLERMGLDGETTVHGVCRASFSTWANELGIARPDVIEACLAHVETNQVRASYNRASFAAERRNLLVAWTGYCNGEQVQVETLAPKSANVVRLAA